VERSATREQRCRAARPIPHCASLYAGYQGDAPMPQHRTHSGATPTHPSQARHALLLAAHGERRAGATNAGLQRLAQDLAAAGVAGEVAVGFLNGVPTIAEAMAGFHLPEVIVYPMFLAEGFFAGTRLPTAVGAAAGTRRVHILPPLGLDRALADLVARKAGAAAQARGAAVAATTLVLLAHGSSRDAASRDATVDLAARLGGFAAVRIALLEEPPSLAEVLDGIAGPAVVVGLFAGEGLHGGEDLPDLIAGRDVATAGIVGAWPEIAALVAAAVRRALA
jgi:sirohydrochlorin cobaltochelatase